LLSKRALQEGKKTRAAQRAVWVGGLHLEKADRRKEEDTQGEHQGAWRRRIHSKGYNLGRGHGKRYTQSNRPEKERANTKEGGAIIVVALGQEGCPGWSTLSGYRNGGAVGEGS